MDGTEGLTRLALGWESCEDSLAGRLRDEVIVADGTGSEGRGRETMVER